MDIDTVDTSELPVTILDDLERLLPELTPDEKADLRNSIEAEGVRDNLLVWRTVNSEGEEVRILIDGHNRYRITESLGRNPGELPTREVDFADMAEAKAWIIANQLMRRNLSDSQRSYFRGMAYQAAKEEHGGDRKSSGKSYHLIGDGLAKGQSGPLTDSQENQHTESGGGKSCHKQKTAQKLAEQFGVSEKTIRNDAAFTQRVNALPPEERGAVLSGKKKLPKVEKKESPEPPSESTQAETDTTTDQATPQTDPSGSIDSYPLASPVDAFGLIYKAICRVDEFFDDQELAEADRERMEFYCDKVKQDVDLLFRNIYKRIKKTADAEAVEEPEEEAVNADGEADAAFLAVTEETDDGEAEEETEEETEEEESIPVYGNVDPAWPTITLRVTEGPSKGQAGRLGEGVLIIGTDPICRFTLEGTGVSALHAILRNSRRDDSGPVIHVYEAGSPLEAEKVRPKDIIAIPEEGTAIVIGENTITVECSYPRVATASSGVAAWDF